MPVTPLTLSDAGMQDLVDIVKIELGYDTVCIPIQDTHIVQAINNALRTFNMYMMECQHRAYYNQSDAVEIDFGDDYSDVRGVMEVKILFPQNLRAEANINIFEIIYRMVFPNFSISDWYFFRMYYEQFQYIRGSSPTWEYNEMTKKLYVDCHGGPFDIYVVLGLDLTPTTINAGKFQYKQKFIDLCVARTKQIMAHAMEIFKTIPAPGGTISTDAPDLRREGLEKQKEIEEWLQKYAALTSQIVSIG